MSTPSGVPQAPVSAGGVEGQAAVIGEVQQKEMYSLRFDGSSYLENSSFSTATNNRKWTFSAWVKPSKYSGFTPIIEAFTGGHNQYYTIGLSLEQFMTTMDTGSGGVINVQSTGLLRDFNAWYHLILAFDTIDGSLSLNHKFYINGVDRTQGASLSYTGGLFINSPSTHRIGHRWNVSYAVDHGQSFRGYLSNTHFIDGEALEPSAFGELISDVWRPASYSGDYGVNGFHLDFDPDNMVYDSNGKLTQVKDASGNDNHWTAN